MENSILFLSLSLISFLLESAHSQPTFKPIPKIEYHNGPLLTGEIKLSLLWYGGKVPQAFDSFIQSLKDDGSVSFDPKVSDWWKAVESYQALAKKNPSPCINVKIVSKIDDENFSLGRDFKNLDRTIRKALVSKATKGNPDGSTIAVIVFGEEVTLPCGGNGDYDEPCYEHGIVVGHKKQIYILVKNQLKECGWVCAWPFHKFPKLEHHGVNIVVDPPTWDEETHLSIIHFASALASTVTNPYGDGFYAEGGGDEVGSCCSKAFGRGYLPGFTGRIYVDPNSGGAFNVHGVNDTKFMLPGLWNPRDSSKCWTIL